MNEGRVDLEALAEAAQTRDAFAAALRALGPTALSAKDVRAAIRILEDYPEPLVPLRLGVLSSYTTDFFEPHWTLNGLLHGLEPDVYRAPYGQIIQEFEPESGLQRHGSDVVYILTRWSDLHPALGEPLGGLSREMRDELLDLAADSAMELVASAERAVQGSIVLSVVGDARPSALGLYESGSEGSEEQLRNRLKRHVVDRLALASPGVHFDDADHLVGTLGLGGTFDARLWSTARFPFTTRAAALYVHRLFRYPVLLRTPKVKCIVLDCDNTLWGGIVGEDGMHGIHLGPEYPGSCYVDFQRRLLDFVSRGALLALCSKNELGDVERVLRDHPSMVLREERFSAIRVNWSPKPDNIRSIAEELNLGLDSLLFVDDSAFECRMVREMVPEVRVVQAPHRPIDLPTCLDALQELEILAWTEEDRHRSKMYVENRQRREHGAACESLPAYLESLGMKMEIHVDSTNHVPRLAQLTQKTNQFNLTTRRYTEADVQGFVTSPEWLVVDFQLSDVFGDSGIVGLALVSGMHTPTVTVDTLLLSCRVLGRQCEDAFVHWVLSTLKGLGKEQVIAEYLPTKRNNQVADFWPRQGFESTGEGQYVFALDELPQSHSASAYFEMTALKEET